MNETAPHETVLIVGAGPTGLSLAIELLRFGVPVRLIDKADHPAKYSQALVVQARTLEQFARYDLADKAVARGRPVRSAKFWSGLEVIAEIDLTRIPSLFPFALVLPQNETETLLLEYLATLGGKVERQVELTALDKNTSAGATAYLKHPDGRMEEARFRWTVGCDGAHSAVRHALNIPFEGDAVGMRFALGDLHLLGEDVPGEEIALHWRHGGDVLFIAKIKEGLHRVIVIMRGEEKDAAKSTEARADHHAPDLAEFNSTFERFGVRITADASAWSAPFHVNERKAERYREGSVFLAGDASHIHSPAGGQGMNTGIQDAANLAWKLAAVYEGAEPELLNSYDAERGVVGKAVLRGSSFGLRLATVGSSVAEHTRNFVLHHMLQLGFVQDAATRALSEVAIGYRDSPAVKDKAHGGTLRAGDRMPDAKHESGTTLLAPLRDAMHLMIAVDTPQDKVPRELRHTHVLALQSDDAGWSPALAEVLGSGPMLYMVRPDGYIGFRATGPCDPLSEYGLQLGLL